LHAEITRLRELLGKIRELSEAHEP
jgi:hypothetical protein